MDAQYAPRRASTAGIVFDDVISTASHTVPSLLDALSFQERGKRRGISPES